MNATDVADASRSRASLGDISWHVKINQIPNISVMLARRGSVLLVRWRNIWTQSTWRQRSLSATYVTSSSIKQPTSRNTSVLCTLMRSRMPATSVTTDVNRKVISPDINSSTPQRRCTSASSVENSSMRMVTCRNIFQPTQESTSTIALCVTILQVSQATSRSTCLNILERNLTNVESAVVRLQTRATWPGTWSSTLVRGSTNVICVTKHTH